MKSKKLSILSVIALICIVGCRPMIKVNIDTYLQNPGQYKKMDVVFTTNLDDLLERYELYKGKEIEITAPATSCGTWKFWTWYLMLEKNGKKVRAYESEYRIYPDLYALDLMKVAKSEGGEVTVIGKLNRDGIELDRLAYKDFSINTNIKTYRPFICPTDIRIR